MSGITRTSRRYWADGPDYFSTYYTCSHDPDDPRHTAPEGHPRTISVREDHLLDAIRQFFAQRVFGPDRAALLAADLPATAADDQARRDRQTATLTKRLRKIDAAENAHAREIETLAHLDNPHAPAVTALRSRVLARFTELEDERTTINTQLASLAKTDTGLETRPCSTPCRCWETCSPTPRPRSSSSYTKPSTSKPCTKRTCTRSPCTSPSPTPPPAPSPPSSTTSAATPGTPPQIRASMLIFRICHKPLYD